MKTKLVECNGCFSADFTAETVGEAALLTRLGMNSTSKLRACSAYAYTDGTFTAHIVVAKHRRSDSRVPKRR